MCGIAGVRRYGNDPITEAELDILLCSLEHRGKHATGVALMTEGKVFVHKAPMPAWAFVAEESTKEFFKTFLTPETTIAILHTRYSTIGNPENNVNNHPISAGRAAIVHNGGIHNHHLVFNQEHLDRACETDSDIIRALIDRDGLTVEGLESLNKLSGSAAIAAISEDDPTKLLLARSGSPLAYATTPEKLWWASEMGAIQKAVKPWTRHHGLYARKSNPNVSYYTMPDNTAYLLGEEGSPIRREFKTCMHYVQPDYSRGTGGNYGTRMREYRRQASSNTGSIQRFKIGPCPKCFKLNRIKYEVMWNGLTCFDKECKARLDYLDQAKDKVTTQLGTN